ncbi:hypothetical protein BSUBE1_3957 [Bacillus subtilis E1]|nr:hypothetical protein BSUBE1_3957 [Bacillus subtilis E1]
MSNLTKQMVYDIYTGLLNKKRTLYFTFFKEAAEHVKKLPLRAAFFYFFLSGSKMPF